MRIHIDTIRLVSFTVVMIGILVSAFVITLLIRNNLRKKYIKKFSDIKEWNKRLQKELESLNWKELNQLSANDVQVNQMRSEKQFDARFEEISQRISSSNIWAATFDGKEIEKYNLKDIQNLLRYANNELDQEESKIDALNDEIDELLIMTKYQNAKPVANENVHNYRQSSSTHEKIPIQSKELMIKSKQRGLNKYDKIQMLKGF